MLFMRDLTIAMPSVHKGAELFALQMVSIIGSRPGHCRQNSEQCLQVVCVARLLQIGCRGPTAGEMPLVSECGARAAGLMQTACLGSDDLLPIPLPHEGRFFCSSKCALGSAIPNI